jgi:cell division septation protein DedD
MRFDIGPGGGFVVLVGLLGLSAAVFFLGMISGREMAQSEQGQNQLASVYPMPAAPAPPPAPAAAATSSLPPPATSASENIPPAELPKPPAGHKAPPRPTLASVPPSRSAAAPPPAESSAPSEPADSGDKESAGTTPPPPPPAATRRNGYNIVIDAAMDRAAANRMASRLLALGYTSHIVPSQINGQTWYRVQVGPYPTADDARSAQEQLRAAYTARYVNRAGGAPAGAGPGATSGGSTDTDTTDSGTADAGSDDSGGGASAPSAPTD